MAAPALAAGVAEPLENRLNPVQCLSEEMGTWTYETSTFKAVPGP